MKVGVIDILSDTFADNWRASLYELNFKRQLFPYRSRAR